MAITRCLVSIFVVSLAVIVTAKPQSEYKVTANDVHLNAVLPEADTAASYNFSVEIQKPDAAADNTPSHLELQPEGEESTTGPSVGTISPVRPGLGNDHTYFSRVINSIFEIPIAVLTAVRNLLQTTAAVKKTA